MASGRSISDETIEQLGSTERSVSSASTRESNRSHADDSLPLPPINEYVPPPSVLTRLLRRRQWTLALGRAEKEARMASHDGCPLHVACALRPRTPLYVLRYILRAYPQAARECRSECGSLPMHILVNHMSLASSETAMVPMYRDQRNQNNSLEKNRDSTNEPDTGDNLSDVLAMLELLHEENPEAVSTANTIDGRLPIHVAAASTITMNGMVGEGARKVLEWLLVHTPAELVSTMQDAHGYTAMKLAWRGVRFYCTSCRNAGSREVCDCLHKKSIPISQLHPLLRTSRLLSENDNQSIEESIEDSTIDASNPAPDSSSDLTLSTRETYTTYTSREYYTQESASGRESSRYPNDSDESDDECDEQSSSQVFFSDVGFSSDLEYIRDEDQENDDTLLLVVSETFSEEDDEICQIIQHADSKEGAREEKEEPQSVKNDSAEQKLSDSPSDSLQLQKNVSVDASEGLVLTTSSATDSPSASSFSLKDYCSVPSVTRDEKDADLPREFHCTTIIRKSSPINSVGGAHDDQSKGDDSNESGTNDMSNATPFAESVSFDTGDSAKTSLLADDEGGDYSIESASIKDRTTVRTKFPTSARIFPIPKPIKRANAVLRMKLRVTELQRPHHPRTVSNCAVGRGKSPNPYFEIVVAQKTGTCIYKSYPLWRCREATWDEAMVDLGVPSSKKNEPLQLQVHIRLLHLNRGGKAQLIGTCRASNRGNGLRKGPSTYPIVNNFFEVLGQLSILSMSVE